jgi:RES domain-containing protein
VPTAWRIVKAKHQKSAFDGEGARAFGGRWNSPGSPLVYASETASLAALEMLVHLGRSPVLHTYVLVSCEFPDRIAASLDRRQLPSNWRAYPAPPALQLLGDRWLKAQTSAVLEVPSAIIEGESNYLLNPRHPDFAAVRIGRPAPFDFDVRLLTS